MNDSFVDICSRSDYCEYMALDHILKSCFALILTANIAVAFS